MDAKKLKNDIIIYLLLLIACAALFFWITPEQIAINANLVDETEFTPQTFPNLLTGGIAIASLVGLISSIIKYRKLEKQAPKGKKPMEKHELITLLVPYVTFAVIIIYNILFEKLGYIWATLVVAPIMMFLFGCRKWYFYLSVYGFAALMYVLFKFVLNVPLP